MKAPFGNLKFFLFTLKLSRLSYSKTKQPMSLAALRYCLQWFRPHIRRSVPGKGGVTWFPRAYRLGCQIRPPDALLTRLTRRGSTAAARLSAMVLTVALTVVAANLERPEHVISESVSLQSWWAQLAKTPSLACAATESDGLGAMRMATESECLGAAKAAAGL